MWAISVVALISAIHMLAGAVILMAFTLPASAAGVGCEGEWASSPICLERQEAVDERARAEALLERLPDLAEPPWDPLELDRAESLYREGMALYRDEYFGDAAAKFRSATELLLGIEAALNAYVAQHLAAAEAALGNEDFKSAASGYESVLRVIPESGEAADGLSAASRGMAAREALDEARRSVDLGDLEAAESQLRGIPPGVLGDEANQARRRIAMARQQDRFNRTMSRGYRHLDRAEWPEAEAAFAEALQANPESTAARDALEDLRRRRAAAGLASYRNALQIELQAENWAEARALLERMQEIDADDATVAGELARIAHLADVEARIDGYLSEPHRLAAKGVREEATALAGKTADSETVGERITSKREALLDSLATWTTPVEMTIRSDDRTEVHIRPGRVLGKFRERRLEVYPGNYVLSGRRVGYREVVLKVSVAPGADDLAFEVACDERF